MCACLIFAGKGTPLTIPMFSEVARKLAVNKKKKTFFTSFHERFEKELTVDDGKITSPTRSLDTMLELTKDFILDYNMLLARGKAHEKNIFVFDETIIGCNPSLPLVIG